MSATDFDAKAEAALAAWAVRNLPARLDVNAASRLLGFTPQEIQILMAGGKLTPLGHPAQNAPKWFPAVELIGLSVDREWLDKATKEVSKYWRQKRERRGGRREIYRLKVSPESSPVEPLPGVDGAVEGGERAVPKAA
jgi:hypothetical protein